jgi:hypothetical protein
MCRCGQALAGELNCRTIRRPEWRRKDALAGDRRRANKEANLPLAGNYDGLGLGRGSSQLHDDDDGRSSGHGRHCVHGDAELAMVGIALAWVQVRDLSNGERGKKDEAQDGDGRQETGRHEISGTISGAAFAAENCGESRHGACQPLRPSTSILQKAYRSLDAMGAGRLHRSYNSETSRSKKRQPSVNV